MAAADIYELERDIKKKLTIRIYQMIKAYVKTKRPTLWGLEQPKRSLNQYIILSLAKDLLAKSYSWLIANVKCDFKLCAQSTQHNIKKVRKFC
jgi:hypothetical protein